MRRFLACSAMLFCCLAMAGAAPAGEIVALDIDAVYEHSIPGKAAAAKLKSCNARLVAQLNALRGRAGSGRQYSSQRRHIHAEMEKLRTVYETEQKRVKAAMDAIVRRALDEYRREHPFDGVLPKKSFYRVYAPLDITREIIQIVNREPHAF